MTPLAPLIVLTIHNPQADLQKLRPALEWIGRAEPMLQPERIERWSKQNLGIDKPFDPSSLAKRGLDPKAPIRLTFPDLALEQAKKPKGKGPITIEINEYDPIERALIDIDPEPEKITAEARIELALAARLIADDFIADRPARRYLAALSPVVELSGTAGQGAIREGLIEAGMSMSEADRFKRLLAGEHAVALLRSGFLAGAVRLSGSAKKKDVAAFIERLTALQPGIQIRELGGFLLGWFPGDDPKAAIDLSSDRLSEASKADAPVDLRFDPRGMIGALRKRARPKVGPFVLPVHLTLIEALYENLMRKTSSARLVASKSRQELRVSAVVEIE